eukprot:9171864-Pyramimonas_sp.AAC.2
MDTFTELDTTNSTLGMRRRQVTQVRDQVTTQARKTVKVLQVWKKLPERIRQCAGYLVAVH